MSAGGAPHSPIQTFRRVQDYLSETHWRTHFVHTAVRRVSEALEPLRVESARESTRSAVGVL